jgi:hypothetical protein
MDGPPAVSAPRSGRRELVRLAAAAIAFAVTLGVAFGYTGLLFQAREEFSDLAPFHGWQLWTTEAALGAVVAAASIVAGCWWRRAYRSLRDRSPHRRAVVMAVVLPGLAVGAVVGQAARPALTWASDHTAAAGEERERFDSFQREVQRAPLAVPLSMPSAPAELAVRLLSPGDLGAGWYDSTRPNPASRQVPADAARDGATAHAASWLVQAHRAGGEWAFGLSLLEHETRFRTSKQAETYLRDVVAGRHDCGCGAQPAVLSRSTIHGLPVWQGMSAPAPGGHLWAVFTVGDRVFVVIVSTDRLQSATHVNLTRPVRQAVARARPAG